MNLTNLLERIKPWLKPGLLILLGLILICRPDSITSVIGTTVGFLVSLVGCGLLVSFFFGSRRDGLRLAAAIILMVLGFSIIQYPLSLATQLGRFIGILLVLQSVRELTGQIPLRSKTMSTASGIVGVVLMLVPITTYRLVSTIGGIVVLLVGIGMCLDRKHSGGSQDDNIIDAR